MAFFHAQVFLNEDGGGPVLVLYSRLAVIINRLLLLFSSIPLCQHEFSSTDVSAFHGCLGSMGGLGCGIHSMDI